MSPSLAAPASSPSLSSCLDGGDHLEGLPSPVAIHPQAVLSPLVKEEDVAEIEAFLKDFPSVAQRYIPVAVIGEGKEVESI